MKRTIGIAAAVLVWVTAASAQQGGYLSEREQEEKAQSVPLWVGMGIVAGGGMDVVFPPRNPAPVTGDAGGDNTYAATPFEKGGAGMGAVAGGQISARILNGRAGLTVGVMAERNRLLSNDTVEGVDGNWFKVDYSLVRVPFLLQWYRVAQATRWILGVGPEILVGINSWDFRIESDYLTANNNKVTKELDLAVALQLGWGYKFGDWVLGVDLRSAFNVTAPFDYADRVEGRVHGYAISGSHVWDLRVLVGLMYELGVESR